MLQHVIKWAVVATVWRQLRPFLWGTLLAIVALLLVDTLHGEFVEYLRLSTDLLPDAPATTDSADRRGSGLLLSFAIKWLGFVAIGVGWLLYVRWVRRGQQRPKATRGTPSGGDAKRADSAAPAADLARQQRDDAAFDFLRQKPRLEGRGDKILRGDRFRD